MIKRDKKELKAIVIGGGIHGLTASIALATNGIETTILEKRTGILRGTSGSTHNRAHLGYHYPRSVETALECYRGLEFFRGKYPQALFYPKEAYYIIGREKSRISAGEFMKFCNEIKIPYELKAPENGFVNKSSFEESFKVPEPVFDINILAKLLEKECLERGIIIRNNSELIGSEKIAPLKYKLTTKENGAKKEYEANLIINSTYAYANNILRIFGLEKDMTKYIIQTTEVAITESKRPIPAMTIMDGEFVSLMPLACSKEQNIALIYDVIHSVVNKHEGYFLDDTKKYPSNLEKMIEHGEKYFPFMRELKYKNSLWGYRPIPVEAKGDSRTTRIVSHEGSPGVYSILEGKFISAPLIAERLVSKIHGDGIV